MSCTRRYLQCRLELAADDTHSRLHAVSEPFFNSVAKRKPTADPLPPSGSSAKDKIMYTEALGLVMIDYGDAVVGGFGKWYPILSSPSSSSRSSV